jgi:1-deoxy-D-xylulose-5-phosphate synthase
MFFDTPNDLLIWDVGHQAYGHKILTSRRKFSYQSSTRRYFWFPKSEELRYFWRGPFFTSISAALGMAIASNLKGDFNKHHIAIIGDASILQVWLLRVESRGSY